eukprot:5302520-Amphidinium_carterae.1
MTLALALLGSPKSCRRFMEKVKAPTLVRCTGLRRAAHCTSTPRSLTVSSKAGRFRPRQERFTDWRATLPLTTTLVFFALSTMPAAVMAPRTSLKACSSVLPHCCPVE